MTRIVEARLGYSCSLLALTAMVSIATPTPAQDARPEQRVAGFFDALATERWMDAARLIHPARLEWFQENQVSYMIAVIRGHEQMRMAGTPLRPGHEYDASFPLVPRPEVVAQYSDAAITGVGEARTIGAAHALPALEFMTHWLAARVQDPDSVYHKRFAHVPRRIIGVVVEADSVAHVLYRVVNPYIPRRDPADVEIMRLRRHEGQWYLWPDSNNYDFRVSPFIRLQIPVDRSRRPSRDQHRT